MRVLEPDPKDEKVARCGECFARLAYFPEDVKTGRHTDYTGGSDEVFWVVCPKCRKDVAVGRPTCKP